MGPPPRAFPGPFPASPAPRPRATILTSQRGPCPPGGWCKQTSTAATLWKLPNALLLPADVIMLYTSLWPPAEATQGLSHLGLSGTKLPPASPLGRSHVSVSWAAGGGREPVEGKAGVLSRGETPLPAAVLYCRSLHNTSVDASEGHASPTAELVIRAWRRAGRGEEVEGPSYSPTSTGHS